MGPWITTGIDPMKSMTRLKKNGKLEAEFATGDMIFDTTDYIVATARYIMLHPGDTIEISIDGVGTLCNEVVEEAGL